MGDLVERLKAAAENFEAMRRYAANDINSDCEPHYSEQIEMHEASETALEAVAELLRLQEENARLREANRKMHRRAQIAEGSHQITSDIMATWIRMLDGSPYRHERGNRFLFRYALRDINRRVAKITAKLDAIKDTEERKP